MSLPASDISDDSPEKEGKVKDTLEDLRSLYICDLSEMLMDARLMRSHFSQFAPVERVYLSHKRRSCTVHFATHDEAEAARKYGGVCDGVQLNIFWSDSKSPSMKARKAEKSAAKKSRTKSVDEDVTKTVIARLRGVGSRHAHNSPLLHKSQPTPSVFQSCLRKTTDPIPFGSTAGDGGGIFRIAGASDPEVTGSDGRVVFRSARLPDAETTGVHSGGIFRIAGASDAETAFTKSGGIFRIAGTSDVEPKKEIGIPSEDQVPSSPTDKQRKYAIKLAQKMVKNCKRKEMLLYRAKRSVSQSEENRLEEEGDPIGNEQEEYSEEDGVHHLEERGRRSEKGRSHRSEKDKRHRLAKQRSRSSEKERSRSSEKERSRSSEKERSRSSEKERSRSSGKERSHSLEKERSHHSEKQKGPGKDARKAVKLDLPREVIDELKVMGGLDKMRVLERPAAVSQLPWKMHAPEPAEPTPPSRWLKAEVRKKSPVPTSVSQPALQSIESSRAKLSDFDPSSAANVAEMEKLLRQPAHTAEARFLVLEARDMLLKSRESWSSSRKNNQGTCPDMCPEKERYLRKFRRQLDFFEVRTDEASSLFHQYAIKEYARSSADQQMPMPHDLRPVGVLRMTMNYLIRQFMDLADDNRESLGDWYHFLWDRTRSIRKDITQQEICDLHSVAIVEQCARFHIFCSERMREEDLSVYDEKINTENLTKCLQTLKYMYGDLMHKGVDCPNEAEFQAYKLLLNLNSGACMLEVQQLKENIQHSQPIKFATNVYLALSDNNYVRFFKLVNSTTYLNACLLHRYFHQVRTKAVHTMITAYTSSKRETAYPLADIQKLLLFDSVEETADFCRHLHVKVKGDYAILQFVRKVYIPSTPMASRRAYLAIESKRTCSVQEVIVGGILSPNEFPLRPPHDSFNELGVLKPESWDAEDQTSMEPVVTIVSAASQPVVVPEKQPEVAAPPTGIFVPSIIVEEPPAPEPPQEEVSEPSVKDEPMAIPPVSPSVERWKPSKSVCFSFTEEVLSEPEPPRVEERAPEPVPEEPPEAAESTVEEDLQREAVQEEEEIMEEVEEEEETQAEEVEEEEDEDEGVDEELEEEEVSSEGEHRPGPEEAAQETLESVPEPVSESGIQEEEEEVELTEDEEEEEEDVDVPELSSTPPPEKEPSPPRRSPVVHYANPDFTAWFSSMSLEEQARELAVPGGAASCNFKEWRPSKRFYSFEQQPSWPDVGNVFLENVTPAVLHARLATLQMAEHEMFWKLVLSLPDPEESPRYCDALLRWVDETFVQDRSQLADTPRQVEILRLARRKSPNGVLNSSVQRVVGYVGDPASLEGTHGVLMFIASDSEALLHRHQRLLRILELQRPLPILPVAMISDSPRLVAQDEHWLQQLVDSGSISRFKIFWRSNASRDTTLSVLESALQWLADSVPRSPDLLVTNLKLLWDSHVLDDIWSRVCYLATKGISWVEEDVDQLLDLHNSALSSLAQLCTKADLFRNSSGAPEFLPLVKQSPYRPKVFANCVMPSTWGSDKFKDLVLKACKSAMLLPEQKLPSRFADLHTFIEGCFLAFSGIKNELNHAIWLLCQNEVFGDTIRRAHIIQAVAEIKLAQAAKQLGNEDLVVAVRKDDLAALRKLHSSKFFLPAADVLNISVEPPEPEEDPHPEDPPATKRPKLDDVKVPSPEDQRRLRGENCRVKAFFKEVQAKLADMERRVQENEEALKRDLAAFNMLPGRKKKRAAQDSS